MEAALSVFLSYATPDRPRVIPFYDYLSDKGFEVWMDARKLRVGQSWDLEIKRALDRAAIIVVFLSNVSVDRRGYLQREVRRALEKAEEKLAGDVYIVPILLDDDVIVPESLRSIQYVKSSDPTCLEEVALAISDQMKKLEIKTAEYQDASNIRWSFVTYKDEWDGVPGYRVEASLLQLSSKEYPRIGEISDILRGDLIRQAMKSRSVQIEEQGIFNNFGQSRFFRENTWEANCSAPVVKGRILSVRYTISYYFAGAAHPNSHFEAFCFLLTPLMLMDFKDFFSDADGALSAIQASARRQLLAVEIDAGLQDAVRLQEDSVNEGTKSWRDFSAFACVDEGFDVAFAPYQVAAYAFGPQIITIPYEVVFPFMRKHLVSALDLEYMMHQAMLNEANSSKKEEPS